MALQQRAPATTVRAWTRGHSSLESIRRLAFAETLSTDLAAVVTGARCVVLCTPVEVMGDLCRAVAPLLSPEAVVTDAGSVKRGVVEAGEAILGRRFVGAHPIAGSDRTGIDAARADLYLDATCVLTPTPETDRAATDVARALWETAGCRVVEMPPAAHDAALARTSHLPHALAATLAAAIARAVPDWADLVGGGYRDTTRIALGSPELWTGILLANRKELSTSVAEFTEILQDLRTALDSGDADFIRTFLAEGRAARNQLDAF